MSSADLHGPTDDASRPLLAPDHQTGQVDDETASSDIQPHGSVRTKLYISHTLSTFNSRAFEFGAFLFLAAIYPQTLQPASIYALARAGCAALFSPVVGRYIDSTARLPILRISIAGQRLPVALSCLLLFYMARLPSSPDDKLVKGLCLTALSFLACVEKLSAIMNTIAVERDWVVVIADNDEDLLSTMNSQMRRIDLACKLGAPLCISLIDTASTQWAIVILCGFAICSLPIEYLSIARVYRAVPTLQRSTPNAAGHESSNIFRQLQHFASCIVIYVAHPAFLPSFALSLLYLTVLSFSGQMITYLLALGLPSGMIGALRGISAIFELSATWIAPRLTARIGAIRSGIWFINYQIFWVGAACVCLWLPNLLESTSIPTTVWVTGSVVAVILSRVGLWGFDLCVQIIVQEEVEPELRGAFSSQEVAAQNVFEMLSFASTIVFARPEQFQVPASISACAVLAAGVLYACFVRVRRGHLVHLSTCIDRKGAIERGAFVGDAP